MPNWMSDWPFAVVYVAFVIGAALRSQVTYWIGRGITAGVLRTRWAERFEGPRTHRAISAIERWGMPIVPLSFLTVGFQTAVHASAGLLRLRWLRYTLWAVPGWFLWALLWAGGRMAAIAGLGTLAARSPLALALVLGVVTLGSVILVVRARRRRAATAAMLTASTHAPAPGPGPTRERLGGRAAHVPGADGRENQAQ